MLIQLPDPSSPKRPAAAPCRLPFFIAAERNGTGAGNNDCAHSPGDGKLRHLRVIYTQYRTHKAGKAFVNVIHRLLVPVRIQACRPAHKINAFFAGTSEFGQACINICIDPFDHFFTFQAVMRRRRPNVLRDHAAPRGTGPDKIFGTAAVYA